MATASRACTRTLRLGVLVLLLACATGCGQLLACATGCGQLLVSAPEERFCDDPARPALEIDGLYVLPDDSRSPVIEEIDASQCSIDLTIYLISDDEVIDALGRAQARGVTVRVLLEETPFGGFGQVDTADLLRDKGIEVRPGPDEFRFIHAKYMVIDDAVGVITNQNLTVSAFDSNREFGVVTTDAEVVESLAALFESDWDSSRTPEIADRLVVSPVNARDELPALLRAADGSILLYIEVIRDDGIIAELGRAAERGVDVRLIVNAPDDDLDLEALELLARSGVQIRVSEHIYIHAKALVVDGERALIGSHNPTSTSIDDNREVSLVVSDAIAIERVRSVFDRDWSQSAPWLTDRGGSSQQELVRNWSAEPLALDMHMMYGYGVRTVPMGLHRSADSGVRYPSCGAEMPNGSRLLVGNARAAHVAGR